MEKAAKLNSKDKKCAPIKQVERNCNHESLIVSDEFT